MLRGFGPSELALAREGLLLGIVTPEVGGCPKLQELQEAKSAFPEGDKEPEARP